MIAERLYEYSWGATQAEIAKRSLRTGDCSGDTDKSVKQPSNMSALSSTPSTKRKGCFMDGSPPNAYSDSKLQRASGAENPCPAWQTAAEPNAMSAIDRC